MSMLFGLALIWVPLALLAGFICAIVNKPFRKYVLTLFTVIAIAMSFSTLRAYSPKLVLAPPAPPPPVYSVPIPSTSKKFTEYESVKGQFDEATPSSLEQKEQ